jgi:hypothetical protein
MAQRDAHQPGEQALRALMHERALNLRQLVKPCEFR